MQESGQVENQAEAHSLHSGDTPHLGGRLSHLMWVVQLIYQLRVHLKRDDSLPGYESAPPPLTAL